MARLEHLVRTCRGKSTDATDPFKLPTFHRLVGAAATPSAFAAATIDACVVVGDTIIRQHQLCECVKTMYGG